MIIPKVAPRRRVDKSKLMLAIVQRVRSRRHLDWIKTLPCIICGQRGCDPHHLLQGPEPKAKAETASDIWAVPLCRSHHTGQDSPHRDGNELAWAERHGIDLVATAAAFWARSPANRPE